MENIDIGGPAMVRAAAKNFKDVLVITDKNDYNSFINQLKQNKGSTDLKFEKYGQQSLVAAHYDSLVSNWFNDELGIDFPDRKTITGKKIAQLRYGENPHQKSSIYSHGLNNKELGLKKFSGKILCYNNYNDIFDSL